MRKGVEFDGGKQDLVDGLENVMVPVDDIQRQHQQQPNCEFVDMDVGGTFAGDREIFLDGNESSMFTTDFPPLADFPCMSSSSSTSSAPPHLSKAFRDSSSSSSASSSNSAAWSLLKSDSEDQDALRKMKNVQPAPPQPQHNGDNDDCLNVMEDLEYMDLMDANEFWDPCTLFQSDNQNPQDYFDMPLESLQLSSQEGSSVQVQQEKKPQFAAVGDDDDQNVDHLSFFTSNAELAAIFFEWLKQNKDYISAEDMRSIKLKRSTIESASKRLGSTEEGKKKLLRLILEWVQQCQLQKKRLREVAYDSPLQYQESFHDSNPNPNPNPNSTTSFQYNNIVPPSDPNACFYPLPWMQPPALNPGFASIPCPELMAGQPLFAAPAPAYVGDPYNNYNNGPSFSPTLSQTVNGNNGYQQVPSTEYQAMESGQSWPPSQFGAMAASQYNQFPENDGNVAANANTQGLYNQYPYQVFDGNGERLARLGSSATKEARKKRMARQRRMPSHHYRHHNNQTQQHLNQIGNDQSLRMVGESCNNPGNWVYWPSAAPTPMMMVPTPDIVQQPIPTEKPAVQPQNHQKQAAADKRQGWKTEKNLRFLLQKVLKQSDVGNLGRIVLPKKEAETHLPELDSRDGISIAMEDIGTSRVWNMKYRFWPNNKSRMYLLENTGDFVRANGLQEGDFIVIYADTRCCKYLIRGVKVRPAGPKTESKKPAKRNVRTSSSAANNSNVSLMKQLVK